MCIHEYYTYTYYIYIYIVNTWYFIADILKGYATSLCVAIAGVCSLPVYGYCWGLQPPRTFLAERSVAGLRAPMRSKLRARRSKH